MALISKDLCCNGCKHCWYKENKCTAKAIHHKLGNYEWDEFITLNSIQYEQKKFLLRDKEICTGYKSLKHKVCNSEG